MLHSLAFKYSTRLCYFYVLGNYIFTTFCEVLPFLPDEFLETIFPPENGLSMSLENFTGPEFKEARVLKPRWMSSMA